MRYRGYFSLTDAEGNSCQYRVEYSTGYLESAGGKLRRLAYQYLCEQNAQGLSIDGYLEISPESSVQQESVISPSSDAYRSVASHNLIAA